MRPDSTTGQLVFTVQMNLKNNHFGLEKISTRRIARPIPNKQLCSKININKYIYNLISHCIYNTCCPAIDGIKKRGFVELKLKANKRAEVRYDLVVLFCTFTESDMQFLVVNTSMVLLSGVKSLFTLLISLLFVQLGMF